MEVQLPLLMAKSALWLSVFDILSCSGAIAGLPYPGVAPATTTGCGRLFSLSTASSSAMSTGRQRAVARCWRSLHSRVVIQRCLVHSTQALLDDASCGRFSMFERYSAGLANKRLGCVFRTKQMRLPSKITRRTRRSEEDSTKSTKLCLIDCFLNSPSSARASARPAIDIGNRTHVQ